MSSLPSSSVPHRGGIKASTWSSGSVARATESHHVWIQRRRDRLAQCRRVIDVSQQLCGDGDSDKDDEDVNVDIEISNSSESTTEERNIAALESALKRIESREYQKHVSVSVLQLMLDVLHRHPVEAHRLLHTTPKRVYAAAWTLFYQAAASKSFRTRWLSLHSLSLWLPHCPNDALVAAIHTPLVQLWEGFIDSVQCTASTETALWLLADLLGLLLAHVSLRNVARDLPMPDEGQLHVAKRWLSLTHPTTETATSPSPEVQRSACWTLAVLCVASAPSARSRHLASLSTADSVTLCLADTRGCACAADHHVVAESWTTILAEVSAAHYDGDALQTLREHVSRDDGDCTAARRWTEFFEYVDGLRVEQQSDVQM